MRFTQKTLASFGLVCLFAAAANAQAQPVKPAVAKEKAAMEKKADKVVVSVPVDLNAASAKELESVKGIGPATSKKIIAGRPYSSVADLKKIGLSAKQLADISPMLKVGGSAAAAPAPAAKAVAKATETVKATKGTAPAPTLPLAPGGGKGMVWVNEESKVFHREGDRWYGRTKKGKYMTEAEAAKSGAHESKEKMEKK